MKNLFKTISWLFILSTLYFVFSGVSATCTLSLDNYQCNEGESCTIYTGCACFGNSLTYNTTCDGSAIVADNTVVPTTTISGALVTFKFTVTSYTGNKYFVLRLPWTVNYGITYINSSITPNNNSNLSLWRERDPRFLILEGETKTFIITWKTIAPLRSTLPMLATWNVYSDPLFQLLSTQALSSIIDPTPYVVISKTTTWTMPIYSWDTLAYQVTLQNIWSLWEVDLSFLELLPMWYITPSFVSFNGLAHIASDFIPPNIFVRSWSYLVLNPWQIITILISSTLNNTFAPLTPILNQAGFTTWWSIIPLPQNTASATWYVQAHLDVFNYSASTWSANPQMSGDAFSFTFNYGQTWNIPASGLTMLVTISGTNISWATYSLSWLALWATWFFQLTWILNANYSLGTQICATAYISDILESGSTGNNSIIACYTIAAIADLMITKQINPSINLDTLVSGSSISYIITVTNTWTDIATWITLTDILPSQLTFIPNQSTWTLANLNAGVSTSIVITWIINNYPITWFDIINTAITATPSRESTLTNNQTVLTTHLSWLSDVVITKTLSPILWFRLGTPMVYTISYSNIWWRTATGVVITDIFPSTFLSTPTTTRTIWSLSPGQVGTIIVTWTMLNDMPAWQVITNTANITTTTVQTSTSNDTSTITGAVPAFYIPYLDLQASNVTNQTLNSAIPLQAVAWNVVVFTITYANNGNAPITNASISLGWLGWITSITNTTVSLGTLLPGTTWVIIMTGIAWPQNFITFSPLATLSYNTNQSLTDTLTIIEPLVCGDGLVTRTEVCDRNWPVGNIATWQECQNQQGSCVLITNYIPNTACINYSWGVACDTENLPVDQASCSSLALGTYTQISNGTTNVALTCNGANTSTSTRISINCMNGTTLSGFGTNLAGTCNYAPWFNGNASCLVWWETSASPWCSQNININTPQQQCVVRTLDGDLLILDDEGDGSMPVVCEDNNGAELNNAIVNCWIDWEYHNGVCRYNNINDTHTRTITCTANNISCSKDIIQDSLGYCGNGDPEWYEACDDGNRNDWDWCSARCENENNYTPPACFSINNGNISVQEKELMPFRWKLETKNIVDTNSTTCEPDTIRQDSLKCTFNIYNWDHRQPGAPAAIFQDQDCYNPDGRSGDIYDLFRNNPYYESENTAFGKYAFNISPAITDHIYGEYKIVLDEVNYEYCDSNHSRVQGNPVGRICEVNFAVTRPYLAQKSTFGLTPKSTDIDLEWFMDIQWSELVRTTDLDKIMTIDANEYDGWNKIKNMMKNVITKYEKLAITITRSKLSNLEGLSGVTVIKKVPNQNIFIFAGNGRITLTSWFDAPFTLITKWIDVHIQGNLTTNWMFLVQSGKIYFDEPENELLRCANTQTVKGIFVTNKWFSSLQLANVRPSKQRCNYWWLYVKWVLIGDGIDNLVKARRSQLNTRFSITNPSNENSKAAQRRNKIFNGAAVLIEYSPSLRNTLPPWASEFTKALEVYKR